MNEGYFLITSGEDGINIIYCKNSNELKEYIQRDEDECFYFGYEPVFLDKIPDIDRGYFMSEDGAMIIIKSNIIIPKIKKIVEEYAIETI